MGKSSMYTSAMLNDDVCKVSSSGCKSVPIQQVIIPRERLLENFRGFVLCSWGCITLKVYKQGLWRSYAYKNHVAHAIHSSRRFSLVGTCLPVKEHHVRVNWQSACRLAFCLLGWPLHHGPCRNVDLEPMGTPQ